MRRFFLVLFVCFGTLLFADEYIENYQVDVYLKQNGMLQVVEQISYHFGDRFRHGIIRDIPKTSEIGSGIKRNIGLGNVAVLMDGKEVAFEYSEIGNDVRIKIGDPKRVISGKHLYTIVYDVKHGVSAKGDDDALRWNAVGTGWTVPIRAVKTAVHLSETLSQENVRTAAYTGSYGSIDSDALIQWRDARTLEVTANGLNPFEGMTVEAVFARDTLEQNGIPTLPERSFDWLKRFWSWIFAVMTWMLMHGYWWRNGRMATKTVAVRYTPPGSLEILQAGLLLNRFTGKKDFSAGIVDLAGRGCLRITKRQGTVVLERIDQLKKNYGYFQKRLIQILFRRGDICDFSDRSRAHALSLSRGMKDLQERLYQWAETEGYMEKNPRQARKRFLIFFGMLFGLYAFLVLFQTLHLFGPEITGIVGLMLIFAGIGVVFVFSKSGLLFFGVVLAVAYVMLTKEYGPSPYPLMQTPYPAFLLALVPLNVYYKNMGKYTDKGTDTYVQLLGYKEFIKRVELEEVRQRLEENPDFLNQTLPYAMLFGYIKKWIGLLTALEVDMTPWHLEYPDDLYDTFDAANTWFDNTSAATTSKDSSSSGSFAGGGSGGGGGSSW